MITQAIGIMLLVGLVAGLLALFRATTKALLNLSVRAYRALMDDP